MYKPAFLGAADIYGEAGLPLWLRPYEVLVTSSRTALIETITDAISIHAVKSRSAACANGGSLRDHFHAKYGKDTVAFRAAQVSPRHCQQPKADPQRPALSARAALVS